MKAYITGSVISSVSNSTEQRKHTCYTQLMSCWPAKPNSQLYHLHSSFIRRTKVSLLKIQQVQVTF